MMNFRKKMSRRYIFLDIEDFLFDPEDLGCNLTYLAILMKIKKVTGAQLIAIYNLQPGISSLEGFLHYQNLLQGKGLQVNGRISTCGARAGYDIAHWLENEKLYPGGEDIEYVIFEPSYKMALSDEQLLHLIPKGPDNTFGDESISKAIQILEGRLTQPFYSLLSTIIQEDVENRLESARLLKAIWVKDCILLCLLLPVLILVLIYWLIKPRKY